MAGKKSKIFPPEDFIPSLEIAKKYGMWDSTYNWEVDKFKITEFDPSYHRWDIVWQRWCMRWNEGTIYQKPMQQHGAPDLPKGFKLTRDTHQQSKAWLEWHKSQEIPSKWIISEIQKVMNGFSTFFVSDEYPPTHNNIVQLELYRSGA